MKITLTRKHYRSDGIFGEIDTPNNFFFTLEHSYEKKPKLLAGEYTCKRYISPHNGYELFKLEHTPEATMIELHIGNYNEDSEGCILLGLALGNRANGGMMLTSSRQAFIAFMSMFKGIEEFTLVVEDTT